MASELDTLIQLDRKISLQRRRLQHYDLYLEGEQPLRYMAPQLEAEIGDRVTQVVINWPRMCVDAFENRLDIEGFRFQGQDASDDDLWEMFSANDGRAKMTEGHIEHLACGRFYVIVGAGEGDDLPVMTAEHPLQIGVRHNPKTRELEAAVKRWQDDDRVQWANLYTPGARVTFRKRGSSWVEDERDDHEAGRMLITEFLNRGRLLRRSGVSEFHDIIPIADAANKMATDMMISGEFHAMPRRWVVGMTEADFVDENSNQLSAWSAVAGRIWGTKKSPNDVKYGQFDETDLKVFHETIKVLAQLAGQLMYLPQDYMAFTSANPTSADGQRASEARLVKRCERMQSSLGVGWKKVAGDLMFVKTNGKADETKNLRTLEVLWRDASTPTIAQKADATVKLTQGDDPIIDVEQAWEDLGYSEGTKKGLKARRDKRLAEQSLTQFFKQDPATGQEVPTGAPAAA